MYKNMLYYHNIRPKIRVFIIAPDAVQHTKQSKLSCIVYIETILNNILLEVASAEYQKNKNIIIIISLFNILLRSKNAKIAISKQIVFDMQKISKQ